MNETTTVTLDDRHGLQKKLDMLFQRQFFSLVVTLVFSAAVVVVLWSEVASDSLMLWLGMMLLIASWRFLMGRVFFRTQKPLLRHYFWLYIFAGGVSAAAACWGSLPWLLPENAPLARQVVLFILSGVAAFSAASLFASLRIVVLYLSILLFPLAFRLYTLDGEIYTYTAVMVIVYYAVLLIVARSLQSVVDNAYLVSAKNDELANAIVQQRNLARENAMFRNMVDMAGVTPIMVHKPDEGLRVIYANDAACNHFKMDRTALLASSPMEWDVAMNQDDFDAFDKELARNGRGWFETRHRLANGEIIPVSVLVSNFEYEGEKFSVSIADPLTPGEQSGYEQHQLEALQYLAQFEASVPGAMFTSRLKDGAYSFSYASSSIYDVHGVSATRLRADVSVLWRTVNTADRLSAMRAVKQSAISLEMLDTVYRIAHPEKGECWIRIRAMPQRQEDGATLWHGFMYDDTEAWLLREKELQLQEEYRALVDRSPDAIVRYDAELRRIYVNPTWERVNELSSGDVLGRRPTEVGGRIKPFAAEYEAKLRTVLDTGRTDEIELNWLDENGNVVCYAMRVVPEFGVNGGVKSLLTVANDISDRKRVETELAVREREYRSLVESLPDPFFRYDRNGRRTYVNPRVEQLTGMPAEKLLGRTPEEDPLAPARMSKRLLQNIRKVVDSGTSLDTEMEYRTRNGDVFYFDARLGPVFDDNGDVDGVVAMLRDVTAHRLAEKRVRLLSYALDHVKEAAYLIGNDMAFHYINRESCLRLGYSREELMHSTVADVDIAFPIEKWTDHWQQLKSDESMLFESLHVTSDGEVFPVEINANYLEFDGVDYNLALVRDITDRKKLERELAVRAQEFRTLVENTSDTIARYDSECRRLYVNPVLHKALGGEYEAVIGTRPSEIPGGEHSHQYEAAMCEVFATGQEVDIELRWYDVTDSLQYSMIRITPEFNQDGEVVSVLSVGRDITELAQYRERIHHLAFHDVLTGLANRALFNDRVVQAVTDAHWHEGMLGVMILDIDRFKVVNDTMGHHTGDNLLSLVAGRLKQVVREYDTIARLGGDEFAILLPMIRDGQCLATVAEKILQAFVPPYHIENKDIFVGASIGIAVYPDDSLETGELIKYADLAMYEAKQTGGNTFRYYAADLTAQAQEKMQLETELRLAQERGELELYYQPKVNVATNAIIGSEALLRWNSSKLGWVLPDRFIGVAEDTGLIVGIGEWVMREACLCACAWNAPGMVPHKIAVNLSSRQFQAKGLRKIFAEILAETGCRAEWIELEITESLLLDHAGQVMDTLNGLRKMGFTIAIDDFGTGYSALNYLANFPIDVLKIDRSFIRDMLSDKRKSELVKAIIGMVDCLNMGLVAEGVETIEQARFLLENGCSMAQGYLYGKPVPVEMMVQQLNEFADDIADPLDFA